MSSLCLIDPNGRSYSLASPTAITIGRHQGSTICMSDSLVSGRHCQISGGSITDLKSTNGSIVSGKQLQPGVPVALKEGDQITLGTSVFRVVMGVPDGNNSALPSNLPPPNGFNKWTGVSNPPPIRTQTVRAPQNAGSQAPPPQPPSLPSTLSSSLPPSNAGFGRTQSAVVGRTMKRSDVNRVPGSSVLPAKRTESWTDWQRKEIRECETRITDLQAEMLYDADDASGSEDMETEQKVRELEAQNKVLQDTIDRLTNPAPRGSRRAETNMRRSAIMKMQSIAGVEALDLALTPEFKSAVVGDANLQSSVKTIEKTRAGNVKLRAAVRKSQTALRDLKADNRLRKATTEVAQKKLSGISESSSESMYALAATGLVIGLMVCADLYALVRGIFTS